MITWVLFVIFLDTNRYYVSPASMHRSMEECFEARESTLSTFPQPKINYEVICIQSDKVKMQ